MNLSALICLLILIALTVWAIVIRVDSHKRGGGRIARYSPPRGLNLLMAGVLTRSEKTAVAAQLVALAVSKNLRFIAPDRAGERVRLELLEGPVLDGDEYALMSTLFGAEHSSTRVRKLLRKDVLLGRSLRGLISTVAQRLTAEGFVGSRRRGLIVSLRWLFALVGLIYVIAAFGGENVDLWGSLSMVVLVLILTFYGVLPGQWRQFPERAFEVRDHLAGLHDYITLAEADRLRFLQSPRGALRNPIDTWEGRAEALVLNEKLLPYAVLFGHEKEWAKQLEVEYRELDASGFLDAMEGIYVFSILGDFTSLDLGNFDLGDLDFGGLDFGGLDLPDFDFPDLGL